MGGMNYLKWSGKFKIYLLFLFLNFVFNVTFSQNSTFDFHIKTGKKLLESGEIDHAIREFGTAVSIDSSQVEGHYGLGICYFRKKDSFFLKIATGCFSKVLSINSNHSKSYFNRGCCFAIMEKYEQALNDFSSAIRLDSHNGEYYYNRAYVNMKIGAKNNACFDLEKSKKYGFKFNEALFEQCNSNH